MEEIALVTGANGFIGSHLVNALVAEGRKVRCLIQPGTRTGYLPIGVEQVAGDILDSRKLRSVLKGTSTVYHLAAQIRPHAQFATLRSLRSHYYDINVKGTVKLLEAARLAGAHKFIHCSTIAASGISGGVSEDSKGVPVAEYGRSKKLAEEEALAFGRRGYFLVSVLRLGQVFGPRNIPMLPLFRCFKRGILPLVGCGMNSMPVCYVENVSRAFILAEEKIKSAEVYFIADCHCSMEEFGREASAVLGICLRRVNIPVGLCRTLLRTKGFLETISGICWSPWRRDVSSDLAQVIGKDWECNNGKATKELGFSPSVGLREGIRRTTLWYWRQGLL
ncbi:MAG: NAD-dependent epimerase/dehydratase family protein [Candidatus Omnitrophica bacterium]|nr:NAD-dependent epimerase/dehydratase family protein [Candidatus Omnitrophota bacterium]